jgi:Polyketide synthase dehydratase
LATLDLHALKSKISCQKVNFQFLKSRCPNHVKKEDIYGSLKNMDLPMDKKFSLLEGAHRSQSECIAEIVIPGSLNLEILGTTIHPSVIDCMMQTSAILEEMYGTEQELLPVSIGKLISSREIDKKMYVITTQKDQQGDFTFYDVTLTALDGQVIAHTENLSHTSLQSGRKN